MRYSTQMLIVSLMVLPLGLVFVVAEGAWLGFGVGVIPGWLLARFYEAEYLAAITRLGWVRPQSQLMEEERLGGASEQEAGRRRGAKAGLIGGVFGAIAILVLSDDFYYELVASIGSSATTLLVYYALKARSLERKNWMG